MISRVQHSLPVFFSLCLLVLTAACSTTGPSAALYNIGISEVERPADAQERYGEYEVTAQDTTDGTKYVYQDDMINASFFVSSGSVYTSIQNRTEHSIRVNIAEAALVKPSGSSERLITGNMSYANRNQAPQPLVIPQNASAETSLIPASHVSMNQFNNIAIDPIIGPELLETASDTTMVEQNIGKQFRLLLPIKIQDTTNEYTFTFTVRGARITDLEGTRQELTFGDDPPPRTQ